jgi:hypothetical protein
VIEECQQCGVGPICVTRVIENKGKDTYIGKAVIIGFCSNAVYLLTYRQVVAVRKSVVVNTLA